MCANMRWAFLLAIGLLTASTGIAQQGPQVPCAGCEALQHAPWPETGAWYNPEQSGTGLNLEIQNGQVLGFHYGYDAAGQPEWHLFSGALVRSEVPGMQWWLDTHMMRFEGGNCTGCPYQPPDRQTEGPALSIEFLQRNNARVRLGENDPQYFVPITFGSAAYRHYPHETDYLFPEYSGVFIAIVRPAEDRDDGYEWLDYLFHISGGLRVAAGGQYQGLVRYSIFLPAPPPGPDVVANRFFCGPDAADGKVGCWWEFGGRTFLIPAANMNEHRFWGEAEDGWTVDVYRLLYE